MTDRAKKPIGRALPRLAGLALVLLFACVPPARTEAVGRLVLTVVDKDSGKPIPCRMHLLRGNGTPVNPRRVPFHHDHFVFDGTIDLKLPKGQYSFELERGPEYVTRSGHFTINDFADDVKTVALARFVDMSADGWWSGELCVGRPAKDVPLLMRAEDLHILPILTWSNAEMPAGVAAAGGEAEVVRFDENRYYSLSAGRWIWPGGELLCFHSHGAPAMGKPDEEYPAPIAALLSDGSPSDRRWIDLSKPYWWDLPLLVAHGKVYSIGIAHDRILREDVLPEEPSARPKERALYPPPFGVPRYTQDVYFRLLECGFRIPPSAASGSGFGPNPVGYNRMYVFVDGEFNYDTWWEGFRAGRATITNGPLLRPSVDGYPPGHVFEISKADPVEFEIGLTLSTRQPISYLEIIKNGEVIHSIRFDEYAKSGRLPTVPFDDSGWFLVRAVTDLPKTYRFAMTAPYYVVADGKPRVNPEAVRFFIDWLYERARHLAALPDTPDRKALIDYHRQARDFWKSLEEESRR